MLGYQIRIAFKSLRRNPVLTVLLVCVIAVGIAMSTAFVTMYVITTDNPIPHKSEVLFAVEMDSWDPAQPYSSNRPEVPPDQVTYRDMVNIMASDIPTYQSGMFVGSLTVRPEGETARPYRERVRMCFSDFFPMFDVPFQYGGGWDRNADQGPEPVIVIDAETNNKLFGGGNSVGRTLRIEDRQFTIVGVLAQWRPTPRFYDPDSGSLSEPDAIHMPLGFVRPLEIETNGNVLNWKPSAGDTLEDFLQSEAVWLQMWVQLDDEHQQAAYLAFLDDYAREEKKLGRFQRPLNNRLLDVMAWLEDKDIVPEEAPGILIISILFLAVCSVNLIGLLLGKFLARAPEVGVRRALGASRASVFAQHLVECEVVGVLGGALGLGLSVLVIKYIGFLLNTGNAFRLDARMVVVGLVMALGAGAIAGIYPSWRICRIAPAAHLKGQ